MGNDWQQSSSNNRRKNHNNQQKENRPVAATGGRNANATLGRRDNNVNTAGRGGLGFNGTTSFGEGMTFPLEINAGSKAYRKYVDIHFTFEKDGKNIKKDICVKRNDIRQRTLCYQCMTIAYTKLKAFKDVDYTYDNVHTMFTSKPIEDFEYVISTADINPEFRACLGTTQGTLTMRVREADSGKEVDLCDLSQYQTDTILLQEDHSLRTVLEMIVTDTALATGKFTLARGNDVFRVDEKAIERGLCTRLGTKKGVRIIKKEGQYLPALVVDTVHSPFYATENVTTFFDLVLRFVGNLRDANWEEAERFFKGIKVYPTYAPHRVLQCAGFTVQTLGQLAVEKQSLVQYFKSTYKLNLRRLDVPAMIAKNGAGNFPLECLYVVPSQVVDLDACPNYLREKVHRRNAVIPKVRHDEIMKELKDMDINGTIGGAFGIVTTSPIENVSHLTFEHPSKPRIQIGGDRTITPNEDGTFKLESGKFLKAAVVKGMALLSTELDKKLAKDFLAEFVKNGTKYGMDLPAANTIHHEILSASGRFADYEDAFKNLKKRSITFVLMVGSLDDPNAHNFLKLCESKFKVLTQLVTSGVAKRIVTRGQFVTLSNILYKTNVKNGGLNYKPLFDKVGERFDINKGNVLILAYDVSHPGELDSALPQNQKEAHAVGEFPSVVGLVGNVISEPSAFVGNFFYQQSRKEEVITPVFGEYIKKMLGQLVKSGRGPPSTITILRDGVSEGQFGMVVHKELPLIKKACADIKRSWKPKFLVAIVTKRHHKRFVNKDLNNAPVGSFVTDKVVRPDCLEFFMACHKAIKGTTKFVQVSIIHNELNATPDELKLFLHSLSYGHQIVTSPVSLPTPVYQADDVATRGRDVLHTLFSVKPDEIPKTHDGKVDFEALSRLLSYFDSPLAAQRYNA